MQQKKKRCNKNKKTRQDARWQRQHRQKNTGWDARCRRHHRQQKTNNNKMQDDGNLTGNKNKQNKRKITATTHARNKKTKQTRITWYNSQFVRAQI